MGSIFFEILNAGGYAHALDLIAEKVSFFATTIKLPAIAMLVVGVIIAILVGTMGYKYIKLLSTVCFAVAGYGIGEALLRTANDSFGWKLPDYAGIIAGVVLLVLLGFLAFKKIAYAMFGVACFAGFIMMYLFLPNYIIAIAVGAVVALISMYFVRYAFVIITSCFGCAILMAMISAMAPAVKLFQLSGIVGKILAISAALIFASIQFSLTKKESKKFQGPKRVKIRRVFDAW